MPSRAPSSTKYLCATLNQRHAWYFAAQEARSHKDRIDRAAELIAGLREVLPLIVKAVEERRPKADDFFSRRAENAAKAMQAFLNSDIPATALGPVELPTNVSGWQWAAPSLYADIAPLIGSNAAVRFLTAAIPLLSGEKPKPAAIAIWLKQHKSG